MIDYTNKEQSEKLLSLGISSDKADMYLVGKIRDARGNTIENPTYEIEIKPYRDLTKKSVPGFEVLDYIPSWSTLQLFRILPSSIMTSKGEYKLRMGKDFIYYGSNTDFLCYYPIVGDDFLTPMLFMVEYLVSNKYHKFS